MLICDIETRKNRVIGVKSFKENRKHYRTEVNWPVKIDLRGRIVVCETKNISAEGLGFICNEPLPLGEVIYLSLEPQDHEPINFYGKVAWSDVYGIDEENTVYGFGVFFAQISQKDSKQYNNLIKSMIS